MNPANYLSKDSLYTLQIAYKTCIGISVGVGAIKGFSKWLDWLDHRQYRNITYKTIEPIVNITSDVGKLAFNVIGSGVASGLVCATAPISVPIILYVCEDTKPNN